jgi:hypothetical protein
MLKRRRSIDYMNTLNKWMVEIKAYRNSLRFVKAAEDAAAVEKDGGFEKLKFFRWFDPCHGLCKYSILWLWCTEVAGPVVKVD